MTDSRRERATDSKGLAFKYGYQAAADGLAKFPPYNTATVKGAINAKAWREGYEESCEDFNIKK